MPENYDPGKLTKRQKENLAPLKDGYVTDRNKTAGLRTLINEGACLRLENSLILPSWQKMKMGLKEDHPFNKASESTARLRDWFHDDDINKGTRTIADQFDKWQEKVYPSGGRQNSKSPRDASSIGFYLVVEAYGNQYKPDFIDELRKIKSQEIINVFATQSTLVENGSSLDEISKRRSRIPKHQVFIKDLIEYFSDKYLGDFGAQFENGAILGLNVMDELWSKLKLGAYKDRVG